jgi:hypothetical protein
MNQRNLLLFLAGALVGAGVTWLFTSEEGKNLMAELESKAKDLRDDLEKEISKAK